MMRETRVYEPPMLASIGDFARVTLGNPNWGFDDQWTCWLVGCH